MYHSIVIGHLGRLWVMLDSWFVKADSAVSCLSGCWRCPKEYILREEEGMTWRICGEWSIRGIGPQQIKNHFLNSPVIEYNPWLQISEVQVTSARLLQVYTSAHRGASANDPSRSMSISKYTLATGPEISPRLGISPFGSVLPMATSAQATMHFDRDWGRRHSREVLICSPGWMLPRVNMAIWGNKTGASATNVQNAELALLACG